MNDMPVIDQAKCQQCGLCVDICACHALVIENKTIKIVRVDNCGWCTMCELVCPTGAITCPFDIVLGDDNPSSAIA